MAGRTSIHEALERSADGSQVDQAKGQRSAVQCVGRQRDRGPATLPGGYLRRPENTGQVLHSGAGRAQGDASLISSGSERV